MEDEKHFEKLIELLRRHVNLVELVRKCAPDLQSSGSILKAICPFHHCRPVTASLVVNPERQIFHCFACGRGGDVIAFMREACGHASFQKAVPRLARQAGLI